MDELLRNLEIGNDDSLIWMLRCVAVAITTGIYSITFMRDVSYLLPLKRPTDSLFALTSDDMETLINPPDDEFMSHFTIKSTPITMPKKNTEKKTCFRMSPETCDVSSLLSLKRPTDTNSQFLRKQTRNVSSLFATKADDMETLINPTEDEIMSYVTTKSTPITMQKENTEKETRFRMNPETSQFARFACNQTKNVLNSLSTTIQTMKNCICPEKMKPHLPLTML